MEQFLNFADIILVPQKSRVTSRSTCSVKTTFGRHVFEAPVCASNMKSILTYDLCKLFDRNKWFYVHHRLDGPHNVKAFIIKANKEKFNVISISIGVKQEWMDLLRELSDYARLANWRIDYITIDVAHSHTDQIIPFVKFIKEKFPNVFLIVGNGCTPEWIRFLEELNVDCAKVGIGVSESCRTRQYTGFGSATASSLMECKAAATKIKIISDGGLTVTDNEVHIGDVAKAIVLGADMVMSGSLFSRCLDSPAIINGYYGNASGRVKSSLTHVEGTTVNVHTNGLTTVQMMKLITDSLRSSVSYSGYQKLNDLQFVKWRVTK